ncbi:MAG: hypothetical protein KAX49_12970 [Halanaerobiales bacterium]|nr:hypothetical protein [Halanaerobiales bacterium]
MTSKEKIKEYKKKYRENNKEKIAKYHKEYNAKEENKIKARAYCRKHYNKHKKEILEYKRAILRLSKKKSTFKTNLEVRKIEPSESDMVIMRKACRSYTQRSSCFSSYEELLGDGYVGLCIALKNWDDSKGSEKKKNSWIFAKVKNYLIDCYRSECGRNNSPRRKFLTEKISLNTIITCEDGEDGELLDLFEAETIPYGLKEDSKMFANIIKKEFLKLKLKSRKNTTIITNKKLYDIWYDYNVMGLTMDQIAVKFCISESRVSQLYTGIIKTTFEKIQKKILEEHTNYFEKTY